jgi:hypothetical protein
MTTSTADNFSQNAYMGAYGNVAVVVADKAALGTLAASDTIDLCRIPGGARIFTGIVTIATAVTTATLAIGVRYADGTSTGGTTGTAVLSGTGVALTTALAPQVLNFQPFVNDVDTIVYATNPNTTSWGPGANTKLSVQLMYSAEGTK